MSITFKVVTRPVDVEYPVKPISWLFDTVDLAFGDFDGGKITPYVEADINPLLEAHVGSWMIPVSSDDRVVIVSTKREAIAALEEVESKIRRLGGKPFIQALRLDGKRNGYFQLALYSFLGEEVLYMDFYNA